MSSKPPIAYIDIRVFAHATEDPDKVQTAVSNLLPAELAETFVFEKSTVTGHHGNPITLFTATLNRQKTVTQGAGKNRGRLKFAGQGRVLQRAKAAFGKRQLVPAV